jgi:hypothetical protein
MLKKIICLFIIYIFSAHLSSLSADVRIKTLKGEVKVRRGIEETWQQARRGDVLKETDTILTGAQSHIDITLESGKVVQLKSETMLDIIDLRNITEQDLFVYLMSLKVKKIKSSDTNKKIRIGNVSVIHGESKSKAGTTAEEPVDLDRSMQEKNGADALYTNALYPNAIIKLHKLLVKYSHLDDCGELHYYLAKSFQVIQKKGQAMDAYRIAIDKNSNDRCRSEWYPDALNSLDYLKNE